MTAHTSQLGPKLGPDPYIMRWLFKGTAYGRVVHRMRERQPLTPMTRWSKPRAALPAMQSAQAQMDPRYSKPVRFVSLEGEKVELSD